MKKLFISAVLFSNLALGEHSKGYELVKKAIEIKNNDLKMMGLRQGVSFNELCEIAITILKEKISSTKNIYKIMNLNDQLNEIQKMMKFLEENNKKREALSNDSQKYLQILVQCNENHEEYLQLQKSFEEKSELFHQWIDTYSLLSKIVTEIVMRY